ncbi:MAG TPA: carbonic anhydrase [Parvularculaceae bacterium]|nr:carbonic anhydrase [Parvularculaceae bacterium]
MDKIAAGVVRFQQEAYQERRDLFEKLADGQSPEALFITCSDSRIDPNLLTQTEPGELFICRNAGNIVPPHTNHTGAMTASIEFAVGALKVPHIIICGHSECGAMKGAMAPEGLDDFPHVREWLAYARAAVLVSNHKGAALDEKDRLDLVIKENVLLQIAHLKTHPYVAARLATGETEIHGWVYDIRTGDVLAFDEKANDFIPVAEHYKQAVSAVIHTHHHQHAQ